MHVVNVGLRNYVHLLYMTYNVGANTKIRVGTRCTNAKVRDGTRVQISGQVLVDKLYN